MVHSERVAHALLMVGEPGVGKYRFAQALSQLLLCQQPRQGRACRQCHACRLNRDGHHPDLLSLQRGGAGTAIGIDRVRSVHAWLHRDAHQGGCKVLLVGEAHMLNHYAQNALLKILEEPGRETYLVLVTEMPYRLLATVRSRCQQVSFHLPEEDQSMAWLSEHISPGDDRGANGSANDSKQQRASVLLEHAEGRPLLALAMHRDNYPERYQNCLAAWNRFIDRRCVASVVAETWNNELPGQELDWLLTWLRECARFMCAPGGRRSCIPNKSTGLKRSTELLAYDQLNHLIEQNLQARALVHSPHNPNVRLTVENLLVECLACVVRNQRRHVS